MAFFVSPDGDTLNDDESIINLQNGFYDVKKKAMVPHSVDTLSTIQLKCSYPEKWKEPRTFMRFMQDLCDDGDGNLDQEMMDLLQEWIGATLSNVKMYRFKVALFLYSLQGNTGKTQLLNLITKIIGEQNTANIPIQGFSERFAAGGIYGKRLISCGDQRAGDLDDSSLFKQLTGGDLIQAEMKGLMPFSFTFNGAIQAACNDLPAFTDDKGSHVFERMLIIPCRNVIPEERRDPQLLDKMLVEKDQILRWAIEGLHRLIDNGYRFTHVTASDATMNDYRASLDTFQAFLQDNCTVTDSKADRIGKKEFEEEYINYCRRVGITALNKKNIKTRAEKSGILLKALDGYPHYQKVQWNPLREMNPPF